jgi:hypothetical protein
MVRAVCLWVLALLGTAQASAQSPNSLTPEERAEGWVLLFDGYSLKGWQSPIASQPPDDWSVEDGAISLHHRGAYYDIVTKDDYDNFRLKFDWKISKGGNSGVHYRVNTQVSDRSWKSGLEYQILDNAHGEGVVEQSGALFDLYAPEQDVTKPIGEWNTGEIIVRGNHIEHWLNGHRLLIAEIGSADFKQRVAKTKFKDFPVWSTFRSGRIALQDHGDDVAFRNLKLRRLSP